MIRDICVINEDTPQSKALHSVASDVDIFDYSQQKNMQRVVRDLLDTMKSHKTAIGLAAPQIGEPIRVFVFTNKTGYPIEIVNPVIEDSSIETTSIPEGCLSEPGVKSDKIARSVGIKVSGYDKECMPIRLILIGTEAIIFQHELDHLNGKLISDYNDEIVSDEG